MFHQERRARDRRKSGGGVRNKVLLGHPSPPYHAQVNCAERGRNDGVRWWQSQICSACRDGRLGLQTRASNGPPLYGTYLPVSSTKPSSKKECSRNVGVRVVIGCTAIRRRSAERIIRHGRIPAFCCPSAEYMKSTYMCRNPSIPRMLYRGMPLLLAGTEGVVFRFALGDPA